MKSYERRYDGEGERRFVGISSGIGIKMGPTKPSKLSNDHWDEGGSTTWGCSPHIFQISVPPILLFFLLLLLLFFKQNV